MNPDTVQLLDPAALARLAELDPDGRQGLVERVLRTYRASLARLLDQLDSARGAADRTTVRHVAHTLKSSSASVGALALSALCAQVEASIRDQLDGEIDALVAQLLAEGQRIASALERSQS